MRAHAQRGAVAAFEAFGLEKQALSLGDVASGAKALLVGNPSEYLKDLSSGATWKPGGTYREIFAPTKAHYGIPQVGWHALTYGLPALGLITALSQTPKRQWGSTTGEIVGGTVGGMLGMPLGLVGATVAGGFGSRIGRALGKPFDSKPENTEQREFAQ